MCVSLCMRIRVRVCVRVCARKKDPLPSLLPLPTLLAHARTHQNSVLLLNHKNTFLFLPKNSCFFFQKTKKGLLSYACDPQGMLWLLKENLRLVLTPPCTLSSSLPAPLVFPPQPALRPLTFYVFSLQFSLHFLSLLFSLYFFSQAPPPDQVWGGYSW